MSEGGEEALPVSEGVKMLRYQRRFKGGRWWAIVGLFEAFGWRRIALHKWFKRGETWKCRQKFVFRSPEEWWKAKNAFNGLAGM